MQIYTLFRGRDEVDLVFMLSTRESQALQDHQSGIIDMTLLDDSTADCTVRNIIISCPTEDAFERLANDHRKSGARSMEFLESLKEIVAPDIEWKPGTRPSTCRHGTVASPLPGSGANGR